MSHSHSKETMLTNKNILHRNFLNDKLLMKDTRGAFLTKIGPFMVVLEGINRSNSQTPITTLFSFYLLSTYSFLKVYCGTYTETLIVAQVEERERKKN